MRIKKLSHVNSETMKPVLCAWVHKEICPVASGLYRVNNVQILVVGREPLDLDWAVELAHDQCALVPNNLCLLHT